jgi:hypothetical protein
MGLFDKVRSKMHMNNRMGRRRNHDSSDDLM